MSVLESKGGDISSDAVDRAEMLLEGKGQPVRITVAGDEGGATGMDASVTVIRVDDEATLQDRAVRSIVYTGYVGAKNFVYTTKNSGMLHCHVFSVKKPVKPQQIAAAISAAFKPFERQGLTNPMHTLPRKSQVRQPLPPPRGPYL